MPNTEKRPFMANEKKPRVKVTAAVCPHCGGDSFDAPYVERAWNSYGATPDKRKLVFGESGADVEEHSAELENGRCANLDCGAPLDLSALEVD